MDLTSLRRVKARYVFSNTNEDAHLQSFIGTWSKRIEHYCRRTFQYSETHVDFFNAGADRRSFAVSAYPIETVESVATDPTGKYTASYTVLGADYYIIDPNNRSVVITPVENAAADSRIAQTRVRNVRIAYTGGLAEHGTRINVTLSNVVDLAVGDTLTGNISQATGIILTASGTSCLIDVSFGAFEDGETVSNGTVEKTLVQHDTNAICENDMTLTNACEIMVRHSWKMLTDPGYKTSETGRTDRFTPSELADDYTFLPEVRDMLEPYVNKKIRRG